MERYQILTGKNLSIDKYLETWKLDNKIFKDKDKLTKQTALDWFEYSDRSTIVLWDNEENKLVGYITPFLMKHTFASEYILSDKTYKEAIKKSSFARPMANISADIYIFSTAIVKEYRDCNLFINSKSKFYKKSAFKVLNEALVDWICDIKQKGVSINYVFSEKVSDDGEKYLKSLDMKPCHLLSDDCKYTKLFTPSMFSKCSNVEKLYNLYLNENARAPFDYSILENHEYLSVKDGNLYYKDINLYQLVEKYGAPLEVAYTPMITEKIQYLKNLFAKKIKKYKYPKKYNYAYATKANYYSEVVLTALNDVDMLETSSAYDIDIIYSLATQGFIKKGFTVLCNGFKNEKYVNTLKILLGKGINVIPIIENEREFDLISKLEGFQINVGLRYNSDFESRMIKNNFSAEEELSNRFGFEKEKLFKMAERISHCPNLNLKVFHFHFGGTITNIDNYIKGYSNILQNYCELKKLHSSLEYFDFGGGFPIKYSLTYSFDYDYLVDEMIKATKSMCAKNNIECPQLIGEHGRFTAADHSFYIYKIDFTKEENYKNWYIINGSLMNMAPDIWGIQQDFTILPVNLLSNLHIPVCLGGETCDPDDRYFLNNVNVKLFMPVINENETLYVAIFSVGAYQEIISGIGGLHHCLIPEGNELIILSRGGKYKYITPSGVDNVKRVLNILDYNKMFIKNFNKKK
ncbi:MAG: hypothetical protein E7351_01825 [Clostridiales bacterium]|nr:hypothetical protein [Clostridiales bacterium]